MRSDYAEELETEIDHGPHWSMLRGRRASTIRPDVAAAVAVPPRLPRAKQVSSAPLPSRNIQVAPAGKVASISYAPPSRAPAPPIPPHVLAAAARPPIAPLGYLAPPSPYDVQTERVEPLPLESLRPGFARWLDTAWQRFAGPICGAIAGLILVVGYLAYSAQPAGKKSALGAAAVPAPHVVLPAVAMIALPGQAPEPAPSVSPIVAPIEVPADKLVDAPIPAEVSKSLGRPAATAAPTVSTIATIATLRAPAPVGAKHTSRRAPIRLNDATPLGDLRVGRSR